MCSNLAALAVPVTNVRLSNGFSMRGIAAALGTPPQNISFFPGFNNDTWIFNSTSDGFCNDNIAADVSSAECLTLRGGLFNVGASSTAQSRLNVYSTNADPSDDFNNGDPQLWNDGWVVDSMDLNGTTVQEYAMGMGDENYNDSPSFTQAVMGLDRNSTLMTALLAAGHIATRSFAWWWGLNGASSTAQMDGQIVFGGYDAAKVTGDNYTSSLAPSTNACWGGMYVNLRDISLSFPNGSTASLTGSSTLSACLEPNLPVVLAFANNPYYNTFLELTGTSDLGSEGTPVLSYSGMLFPPNNVYDGDLIITLSSGLSFTIPNDILIVPPQAISSDGSTHTNDSVRELLISPLAGSLADNTPYLGKQFFSQAYLYMDYEANTFTLWNAKPTTETSLVTLGQNCSTAVNNATNSQNSPSSSTTATTASSAHLTTRHHSLSSGAIAGIAVGAAIGAAVVSIVAVLLVLRKRRKDRLETNHREDMSPPPLKPELDAEQFLQEMPASERRPAELPSDTRPLELPDNAHGEDKQATGHVGHETG